MRKFLFTIPAFFSVIICSAQTLIFEIQPNWNNSFAELYKVQNIKSDSVYYYKKKKNNKDSTLVMAQYFDSLGNVIERDEFRLTGKVFKITNYTYVDTLLLKEEIVSDNGLVFNNNYNPKKNIITYDHDSAGNVIVEKDYDFYNRVSEPPSITIWQREYDNSGRLIKEYFKPAQGEIYLYHTFNYRGDRSFEMRSYDNNNQWLYSNTYEYDEELKVRRDYLVNYSKTITHETFYNDQKLMIMEKAYVHPHALLDHNTQTYFYNQNNLLESQTMNDILDKNHYYKHYYSK